MNLPNPIGGYFELELRSSGKFRDNAIFLNSARTCLEFILITKKPSKIYIPKYTCDVILQPIHRQNIEYEYYNIDNNLEITKPIHLQEGDQLLYTNYYGLKNNYCKKLSDKYGINLILDCSQAYYYDYYRESNIIYSPRKFFGVPDGGELYTKLNIDKEYATDVSYDRFSHLIKRIDVSPEFGYESFVEDDASLDNQPIKKMSNLTNRILSSVDYNLVKKRRFENYAFLYKELSKNNELHLNVDAEEVPMVFPYLIKNTNIKQYLLASQIYVPTYWPNVYDWAAIGEYERYLVDNLITLPIDQRYTIDDMKRIIRVLNECKN